jgi:alpha-amylase/alpha-mannosidase (GH57 family)
MPLARLNVCFVWHMHQPDYKNHLTGQYQMPWVRLHGIKDYLDMVLMLKDYPRIRQTFNLVPSLMDQIDDYAFAQHPLDDHQRITLQDTLSDADRRFILDRFFDANIDRMIGRSPYYMQLLNRKNQLGGTDKALPHFTDAELFDLTALFHLVWTDPLWFQQSAELQALWQKGHGYTLADRQQLLTIHQEILRNILPTYKQMQNLGQIEVTVTPYYHPILPLLVDTDSSRIGDPGVTLPRNRFSHPEDADAQLTMAINRYQQVFDKPPRGIWPSEQSVSPRVVQIMAEKGIHWTISSEGVLARSLGIGWNKDEYGSPRNIGPLVQTYDAGGIQMVFRHLTLSDLIGFHYQRMHPQDAVNDLMGRLKHIQHQLTSLGDEHGTVTIALDGENCWEGYENDGQYFLHMLYKTLSDDTTLNVCTVSEALTQVPPQPLPLLHTGSWIEDNFKIWIGDPLKNQGWDYLAMTRQALVDCQPQLDEATCRKAWQEIYIAEGSDWFWWYGEPHFSGQDELFDAQFRMHLRNVYQLINQPYPPDLDLPIVSVGTPVFEPTASITPHLDGQSVSQADWLAAGRYECARGSMAMHQANVLLRRFYYGTGGNVPSATGEPTLFIRLECDRALLTPAHGLAIYICNDNKLRYNSPMRLKLSPSGEYFPLQYYGFAFEVMVENLCAPRPTVLMAEAVADYLWVDRPDAQAHAMFGDVLDLAIPLSALKTYPGESCSLTVAVTNHGVLTGFYPGTKLLCVKALTTPNVDKPLESANSVPVAG